MRKLSFVVMLFIISRNLTYATKTDKSSPALEEKISPKITEDKSYTDFSKSTESSTWKDPSISDISELATTTFSNEITESSSSVSDSEINTISTTDLTDGDTEIRTSTEIHLTSVKILQEVIEENFTETSLQDTEITSTEDITTHLSTESTIQETTTDQPISEKCEIIETSFNISDLNKLSIFWNLNDLSSCNSLNVTINLINQSCKDKCNNESCSCSEEHQETANFLNFSFSKSLTPCLNYLYEIEISNSSGTKKYNTISTNFLKYQKPEAPKFVNSTDTALILKVILNDQEGECQDIEYIVECKSNQSETIFANSSKDIVTIENLEPKQNYSCSAKVKHREADWSENSDPSIFTTNVANCNLTSVAFELNNQTNDLTFIWDTNGSEMCDASFVSIELTDKNCVEKCKTCLCIQSFKCEANNLKYNVLKPLTPCATYFYQLQIINSTTSSTIFNSTFDAFRKYAEIKNLTIIDEEEIHNNSKTLNMLITWDYENLECLETFVVSARGQGNYFESSIQGYRHTFVNLEACEEFNINIYIRDQQNSNASATHMMKRINPSEIRNLSLSQENDKTSIIIAWVAPEYGAKCVDRYMIHVKNEFEELSRNTTSSVYLISDVYACINYTITLSISTLAMDNENFFTTTLSSITSTIRTTTLSSSPSPASVIESSKTGNIKTEPRPFNPPQQLLLYNQAVNTLTFTVIPSNEVKNKCSISEYHVECTSNETANKTISGSSKSEIVQVEGLEAFHNYSCKASIENENKIKSYWSYNSTFMTKEGVPNKPEVEIVQGTVNSTSFTIKWKEPTIPKGIIKKYHVMITFENFRYENPPYCTDAVGENKTLEVESLNPSNLFYTFTNGKPSSTYSTQIRGSNQASDGEFSTSVYSNTSSGPSDKLQNFTVYNNEIKLNETYNRTIYINFNYPCRANGIIQKFIIEFKSNQNTLNKTILYKHNTTENSNYEYRIKVDELEPNTFYNIYGYAYGERDIKGEDTVIRDFMLNPGIPEQKSFKDIDISPNSTTTSIYISIPDNLFDSSVGKIIKARIFILQWNCSDMSPKQGFNTDSENDETLFWGEAMTKKCIPEYDTGITIENRNNNYQTSEGIGTDQLCDLNSLCNGKLRPGTTYGLTFRLYTETGYANTEYVKISTKKEVPIVAISIIILSILCLVFLIGFYISCRRTQELRSALDSPYDRKDISVQNFSSYHIVMTRNDNEKIKEEYNAIQYFSDTLDRTNIASRANEKLNRYINIYPYDSTRVVLNNDEFENDYINASYINGYYHPKEYIAAQGPKPDTVLDFWRMVVQHRIESIVMLTSLVENNKVKCHEYFPKLNGTLTSGNITIECTKEQNFPSYIKRLLIVQKNDKKLYVNHYYFCKWPDHGCPSNAFDLIEFVKIVRNERQKTGDTFVVHCSAGVGRTGTFIAVDIMIQRIKREAKINIFDLVKQLRSQRMKMVQSCDQYVFLYTAALELISISRRDNAFQNLRDTVRKLFNELEIPENWKRRNNPPNERETVM
ncbi:receptor-type tyrosine-protein phosphatase H-like isoform X2 [Chironomus tepperi]|uniref:receptor-type tyrosine-protein phosphatase H-like isoform X2 n=1 Tax=Chironomus tepperi TaxID=113505 RepID=UPI00391F6C3A